MIHLVRCHSALTQCGRLTQHGVVKRKLSRVGGVLWQCIKTTREGVPQQVVPGHVGVHPVLDDLRRRDRRRGHRDT